jgi:hypothetical protein
MQAVRDTNPAGVTTKPVIFWDVEGSLKTVSSIYFFFYCLSRLDLTCNARCSDAGDVGGQSVIDDSDVKQQMVIVENGVNYNIKRYNDLRVINDRLTAELKKRLDELDELDNEKKGFEQLDAMKKVLLLVKRLLDLYLIVLYW